mgnify:CR=1 FL=1
MTTDEAIRAHSRHEITTAEMIAVGKANSKPCECCGEEGQPLREVSGMTCTSLVNATYIAVDKEMWCGACVHDWLSVPFEAESDDSYERHMKFECGQGNFV